MAASNPVHGAAAAFAPPCSCATQLTSLFRGGRARHVDECTRLERSIAAACSLGRDSEGSGSRHGQGRGRRRGGGSRSNRRRRSDQYNNNNNNNANANNNNMDTNNTNGYDTSSSSTTSHPFPGDDARVPLPPPLRRDESKCVDDDAEFWAQLGVQVLSFRAGTLLTPDMASASNEHEPVARDGRPAKYPAAVHYDARTRQWVATTEEQETILREPSVCKDPYYVRVAQYPNESPTSLRPGAAAHRADDDVSDVEAVSSDEGPFGQKVFKMSEHKREALNMGAGDWRVVHLGTSSAMPTRKRNVSSTAILIDSRDPIQKNTNNDIESENEPAMFLVDVGEATDFRLLHCDWCMTHGFRWIKAIFITHLHGDHIYGLPKLLWSIGEFAQFRRRAFLEDEKEEPIIHIFGPYGTRGFVRAALHWTKPIGVKFAISELVPRPTDFLHVGSSDSWLSDDDMNQSPGQIVVHNADTGDVELGSGVNKLGCSPPLEEEVRVDDIQVCENEKGEGVWNVWKEVSDDKKRVVEVIAAPLKHRMPCFGYVFRERYLVEDNNIENEEDSKEKKKKTEGGGVIEIDKEKAKALGVYGSQFRVLRSGRPVKISKTGITVTPNQVRVNDYHQVDIQQQQVKQKAKQERKITILGDTCDSSKIAPVAKGCDLLVHEATFAQRQADKARIAMHSTASMAGAFGREIEAKKIVLTHFSSRYEAMLVEGEESEKNNESKKNRNGHGGGGIVYVDDELVNGNGEESNNDDDDDELIFGMFSSPSEITTEKDTTWDGDILAAFDSMMDNDNDNDNDANSTNNSVTTTHEDEEEDEDYVSTNLLVQEAYKGFGEGGRNVEIVAAYDFMQHEIVYKK